jgi:endoglucanase
MTQPVDRFILNRRLGRGVNILGYDPIWNSRDQARLQASHFEKIHQAGFDHVRINLFPFKFMGNPPDYAIQDSWFQILDWTLSQCQKNGLLAILDMHEFIAIAEDPIGLKPKFLSLWKQLATRYHSASEDVIFEILNEPNTKLTPELWNEYFKEPLATIRAANPNRTVIIGPAFWNGIDFLHELKLPQDDPHIILTVHYYHPMEFTHQGAYWSPEHVNKSGIRWLGSLEETQRIQRDFNGVNIWANEHNIPVYLGEFGAYDKADMDSRVRYTNAVTREAERLGWSWGYWQFDSDFIVYDIDHDCWVEPILSALIPGQDKE